MMISNELRDYENALPHRIVIIGKKIKIIIERIYDMLNPKGTYEITFKGYKEKKRTGTISDDYVIALIKNYKEHYGEKKYNFPTS